jgi:acetyltransferase-like isoleucine patch superfamily enzyme
VSAKQAAKAAVRGLAAVATLPAVLSMRLRGLFMDADAAFQASTEWLSVVPGVTGQYLRRAFLAQVTAGCGPDTVIGFGTTFSTRRLRIDGNAYVGAQCNIGWAHIERDALLATGVLIISGPNTHGIARIDIPIRDQPGEKRQVRIGEGAWIGNGAIVLADVGRHAVVAAGSVVTRAIPDYAIAAGVPARVIRSRRDEV